MKEPFANIFAHAHDGIIVTNSEGVVLEANAAAGDIFSMQPEKICGAHFWKLGPTRRSRSQLRRHFQQKRPRGYLHLQKGRRIEYTINPFHSSDCYWIALRDVTSEVTNRRWLQFQAKLLDNLQESVIALDLDGRIRYWGKGATTLFGYTGAEVLGKLADFMVVPEAMEARNQWLDRARADGFWRGEYRQQRKDGTRFWTETSVSLLRDAAGRPYGYLALERDITDRRRYRQHLEVIAAMTSVLRHGHTRAGVLSGTMSQLRSLLSLQEVVVLRNQHGAWQLEASSGDWLISPEELLAKQNPFSHDVLSSGQSWHTDDISTNAMGQWSEHPREGLAALCVRLETYQEVMGVVWGFRSTPFSADEVQVLETAASLLAAALQRVELYERISTQIRQMKQVVETLEYGLVLLDEDGFIRLMNDAARKKLALLSDGPAEGDRLRELAGEPLAKWLTPPENHSHHTLEITDPQQRIFALKPHTVNEGAEGWVLALIDVTKARQQEAEHAQQERLIAIGRLAAGIAHDFNNILASIQLCAQLVQRHAQLEPQHEERLQTVVEQTKYASALVKQLLDYSRRSLVQCEPVDLIAFCVEVQQLLERVLPAHINLTLEHEDEPLIISADRGHLQQIIMNLALNACDAMPDGGELRLAVRAPGVEEQPSKVVEEPASRWVLLQVSDTGEGMTPEVQQRVFEPFFTTKGPDKGHGLGLPQVYGIVKQHNGVIQVDSKVGEGSTFNLYFPLEEKSLAAELSPSLPLSANHDGDATVLVVEDEDALREALTDALLSVGYNVRAVANGQKALEEITAGSRVDVVLSDLMMPEMGGDALYQELQQLQPELPVIVMSGYAVRETQKQLLVEDRVTGWLQKPFTIHDVVEQVRNALENE